MNTYDEIQQQIENGKDLGEIKIGDITAAEWLRQNGPEEFAYELAEFDRQQSAAAFLICSNTESLRPIWQDVFNAEDYGAWDDDKEISNVFTSAIYDALMNYPHDVDVNYKETFPFWHGGAGHAPLYQTSGPDCDSFVNDCIAKATAAAREYAAETKSQFHQTLAEETTT